MKFTRESIRSLDDAQFSSMDKLVLEERFFPKLPKAAWKDKLVDLLRWQSYLNTGYGGSNLKPFRFSHESLVRKAKLLPRPKQKNGVTDFSGWVFSLYQSKINLQNLADGKQVERAVARLAPPPSNKTWDLIHIDPLSDEKPIKLISTLTINGKPLRAMPDLVFREKGTGRILIVERKASNKEIPSDGWPNLRAQLWAYAKCDEWINAPQIILIAEIWGFQADKVFPRAIQKWSSDDIQFNNENAELFQLYRGT